MAAVVDSSPRDDTTRERAGGILLAMPERIRAEPVDCLVSGTVITCDDQRIVLLDGAVAVRGSRVVAVGDKQDLESRFVPEARLGGRRAFVLPGLIDCHSHLAQSLVRSLIAHELPMIYRLYLPAEDAMTLDQVGISARLCMAQLLRCGVTTVAETTATPAHEDTIVTAVEETGMRVVMARGAADQDSHHAGAYSQITDRSWVEPRPGEAERDLSRTAKFLDRHPPVGDQLLRGAVLASHITGFSGGVHPGRGRAGRRPRRLVPDACGPGPGGGRVLAGRLRAPPGRAAGPLGRALGAAAGHPRDSRDRPGRRACWPTPAASVAHSPIECQNILNGVPRVQRLRERGVAVGLGCDNAINDLWEVMRAAWVVHSSLGAIPDYDPEHLPAGDILDMATRDAARALRWHGGIGSLETGKQADLVVVDGDAAHLVPVHDPVTELVRYGTRADVRDVMVAGRLLLSGGRHTTIDTERLYAEAEQAAPSVAAAVTPRRYRPMTRPAPGLINGGQRWSTVTRPATQVAPMEWDAMDLSPEAAIRAGRRGGIARIEVSGLADLEVAAAIGAAFSDQSFSLSDGPAGPSWNASGSTKRSRSTTTSASTDSAPTAAASSPSHPDCEQVIRSRSCALRGSTRSLDSVSNASEL